MPDLTRAGHRKFTLKSATANDAKLQEVVRNLNTFATIFQLPQPQNAHYSSANLNRIIFFFLLVFS